MPVNTSGRIVKTRKGKKGTLTQKAHRYESFTSKISKLNSLDPIRRVRRHDIDAEDLSTSTSYFKAGLEKWLELNLSAGFVAFSQEVLPMCDSLPQILHFENRIMELLITYLEQQERESLAPLLELTTDFAHDLGPRFEKHYSKALELIITIAGTPEDAQVIEASFTALAFMFKYLSKLLVPDLRPTFDLMAPLLGKQRQRPHTARFAAEAMSFLLKKAGAPSHKENSLPTIIQHAKKDLESISETKEFGLYYHGLMTFFAEAMKGNGRSVHTSGPNILKALIAALSDKDLESKEPSIWNNVICGVLTSTIHHTGPETFAETLDVMLEQANAAVENLPQPATLRSLNQLAFFARTIGIMGGVRKGDRVDNWQGLLQTMSNILRIVSKYTEPVVQYQGQVDIWGSLVLDVAILIQYAPMEALIPFISPFMELLTKDPFANCFLTFCTYLSEAGPDRFRTIVLSYFQRFVVVHWSDGDNGDTLSVLLPKMVSFGVLPSNYNNNGFSLPQSWQDQIVSKFERLEGSPFPEQATPYDGSPATWHDRCLPKYNALLEVLQSTAVHPSTNARIAEILLRKLKLALRPSSSLAPEEANFIMGRGFSAFSRMSKGAGQVDPALEPLLHAAAPRYARLPNFLEALLDYENSLKSSGKPSSLTSKNEQEKGVGSELLIESLIANLSTASSYLRLLSLRLLEHIYNTDNDTPSEALTLMIMVEQTPLDLQSARSASMHIRKLATLYGSQSSSSWLKEAIPTFCFGLLTVKFAQIWEDSCGALKVISESKIGEEVVAKIAFKWLETPSMVWDGADHFIAHSNDTGLTDFECLNFINLSKLAEEAESNVRGSRQTMFQRFADAQEPVPAQPSTARPQALRVLAVAPAIAERRSRQLVPMFLSWAGGQDGETQEADDEEHTVNDWTRKDQKVQLGLFASFTNPKSLFKTEAVYDALLQLLANGDIEMQKAALKAVFTWKDTNIKPYEDNLMNLLDEDRFKEEVPILLQGETLIQAKHRARLMPVLLRVLYGRTISRRGVIGDRQGMEVRRLTVLRNLNIEDTEAFIDISLGDLKDLGLIHDGAISDSLFETEILSIKRQVGFVHMIEGVLKELGTRLGPLTRKLADAVLYCLIFASRRLQKETEAMDESKLSSTKTALVKDIRQTGFKCLILLFANSPEFAWSTYIETIEKELLGARLETSAIPTSQGISANLRLFSTWSSSAKMVLLLGCNKLILSRIAECLVQPSAKDEVKLYALNIIRNVVKHSKADPDNPAASQVQAELLDSNMDTFLVQIYKVLREQHDLSKNLLEICVETVSELAPFVTTSTQAHNLVDVSIYLLDQPSKNVTPKTKSGLLLVLEYFVPLYDLQNDPDLKDKVYKTVTSLFGFFKDKTSREVLSRVLLVYSEKDPVMANVASLCIDLNSFAENRLDEPDYDRRLKAFRTLSSGRDIGFTARQWTPLLYNLLFYIKHEEEFGILSSNSSDGLCEFINTVKKVVDDLEKPSDFKVLLSSILMPALFAGMRERSEFVRREYLKVMAHLIRSFPDWIEVSDMHELLAGEDELESSFFNNILTAGKGRQSGALGQISAAAERGVLSSKNVSQIFVPLVEHFIFDRAEGADGHNLAAEATTTVGVLAGSLEWPQYRAILRRYIGYIETKPELAKAIIKLLGKTIDTLAEAAQFSEEPVSADLESPSKKNTLGRTMPKQEKLGHDLTTNILPPLTDYLHDKDDSTVSARVPVAVIVVRLFKLLTQEQLTEKLPPVLTDICHILRSKGQESRDMARDTLMKICVLLGPSCFGFVLKELRGALARGYQLHVLSYTMHSLLVETTPLYAPGDLDYCLPSIIAIIMDDIFGATGQEKDAEEYVSKMKEVKSSKSHDSMELIAKTATLSRLTDIIKPIQVLLKEKLNIRMIRKIDELLNRITNGLLRNSAAQSRDSLVFCYEVIQDVYKGQIQKPNKKEDYRLKRYIVQKGAKKSGERGSTTIYTFKLVRFAFDVLRAVLKKYDDLRTTANLAGFIPILGDAVLQSEEEVKIGAFKLLATIVKVPFKADSEGSDLYRIAAVEATKDILANLSTASEISQAALKIISVVLRDRRDVTIKDTVVDKLLARLKDDMTEPERRHVTFNFLRAVLEAKVETAVVYDTMDYVGTVMVTNDDKDTRDLARGAYFQFLRDFPQKKGRWSKQLAFIVANLKYEREGGRLSMLEVVHLLLSKSSDEFVQEVSATCFVPLIFVLANDESEKCRMAAGELLKEVFKKADDQRLGTFLTLLRSWIKQSDNSSVVRLGLQAYGFYYDSHSSDDSDVPLLMESIVSIVQTADDSTSDWEHIYAALQLTIILVEKFPTTLLSAKTKTIWPCVHKCLSFPHAWIKLSAARLTSTYFADFARTNSENGLSNLPLKGSGGLKLSTETILDLIRRVAQMFRTPGLTSLLADEIVKNLAFLSRVAGANTLVWRPSHEAEDEEEDVADEKEKRSVLDYIFGRLSFILRQEPSAPRAPALIPKTSSLHLLTVLTKTIDIPSLTPCLQTILLPLQNLVDPNIAAPYSTDELFREGWDALKSGAEEIMENLKRRVGTQVYTEAVLKVRKGVKERREGRSRKRKVMAVSEPVKYGEEKRKKVERKKERRKERGAEHGRRRNEY